LLTTAQAAVALGVNASRVRQIILAGKLPAEKHGRDWIIKTDDLEQYRLAWTFFFGSNGKTHRRLASGDKK
jgi:excisionase family DNA binding protein